MIAVLYIAKPQQVQAQNNGGAIAGVLAGAVVGAAVVAAAVEAAKEAAEQQGMEYILTHRPDLTYFELKTRSFSGVKGKDISSVNFLVFEVTNFMNSERSILFAFSQSGFANANGISFKQAKWKLFKKQEWNDMMKAYINLATSGRDLSEAELASVKIVNKGVKKDKDFLFKFDDLRGDVYKVLDYSPEFKLVFNERSLGLFLKDIDDRNIKGEFTTYKSSLVQVRRKTIIKTHAFLNGYAINDGGKREKGRK